MAKKKGFDTRSLNTLLKKLGQEFQTVDDDGAPVTKEEALIRQLWNTALGYEETTRDDVGVETTIRYKPQRWAIELIYNRREGAIPTSMPEVSGRLTAAETVSELATERLNKKAKNLGE